MLRYRVPSVRWEHSSRPTGRLSSQLNARKVSPWQITTSLTPTTLFGRVAPATRLAVAAVITRPPRSNSGLEASYQTPQPQMDLLTRFHVFLVAKVAS